MLPALLGASPAGRRFLVEQSTRLSLRDGNWKYIPSGPGNKVNKDTNTEMGNDPAPHLYDLSTDIGETGNLAPQQAGRVKAMSDKLELIRNII